jgi:hypothetical protein
VIEGVIGGISFVFVSFKKVSQKALAIGLETWNRCGVYFDNQTLHVHIGRVKIKVGRRTLEAILVWMIPRRTGPGGGNKDKILTDPILLNNPAGKGKGNGSKNSGSQTDSKTDLKYRSDLDFQGFRDQHVDKELVVSIVYMEGEEVVPPPRESTPQDVVKKYYASTSTNPFGIRARAIHGALPLTSR